MKNKSGLILLGVVLIGFGFWFIRRSPSKPSTLSDIPLQVDEQNSVASQAPADAENPANVSGANLISDSGSPSTVTGNSPGAVKDLQQFLQKYDKKADWRINKSEDGRVIAISGGMIPGLSSSAEKELAFAREIAEMTGVPGDQINASETKLEKTPYTEARQYDQEFGGYMVFGGYMKVFHRKSDGAVYYIANETQNVGDVDLRIRYSFAEAKAIALQRYSNKTGVVVENNPSKPVIFVDRPGHGELCWEALVRIQGPLYDYRHILVSAISGQILKDITLVKN